MRIIIYLTLIIIGAAFLSFVAALIFYYIEQHDLKDLKKSDEEYNQKMIDACERTKAANKCPKCCRKCAWNTRMHNGVIEFRRKP